MDQSIIRQIKDAIAKNNSIAVVVGKDPTMDSMGAALSLFLSLSAMGKQVSIATPQDPLVEVSSLVGIDKVKTDLSGDGGDLVVSFPYKEKEIEKVSYTLEDGYLNIIVKAGENGIQFKEQDIRYKRSGGLPTLLFVIGTQRLSDLGRLFDPEALKDTTVVNIDIKNDNQGFGDIVSVTPRLSSVSEAVTSLLQSLQVDIDPDMAQNLLSGISYATNNFQKPSTSFLAFEMAGYLLKHGAMRQKPDTRGDRGDFEDDFFFPAGAADYSRRPQQQSPRPTRDFRQMNFPQRQNQQGRFAPRNQQQNPTRQTQQPEDKENQEAPPDWLAPKIYKGSTNI